jgi:hypothetical protein
MQQDSASVEYRQISWAIGYRFGGDGSVWSRWKMGRSGGLGDRWRQMAPIEKSNGKGKMYLVINLRVDGKPRQFYVHRLILEAFVGPCPDGLEGLHHDDDHTNNRIGNLRWGTHVANVEDSRRNGTCEMGLSGSRNRKSKLREFDIPVIRRLALEGVPYPAIAVRFGITASNVSYIVRRKTWAHVA